MNRKLLPFLLASLSSVAIVSAAEVIDAKIHPHGLYSGKAVTEGMQTKSTSSSGFEVFNELTNVSLLQSDAVQGAAGNSEYVFSNLRVWSDQTTLDDYLIGYYSFDWETLELRPTRFERAAGVGVYEPQFRTLMASANDAISPISFNFPTNNVLKTGDPYTADLKVGQRLNVVLRSIPLNYNARLVVVREDGTTLIDERFKGQGNNYIVFPAIPIMISAEYTLRVFLEGVVNCIGYAHNENLKQAEEEEEVVANGEQVNFTNFGTVANSLGYGSNYQKRRIVLYAGQTISVPTDSYGRFRVDLVNDRGLLLKSASGAGVTLTHTVLEPGTHYLVFTAADPGSGGNKNYNGVVSVTTPLAFSGWSAAHRLPYGSDLAGEDADGDGVSNLTEYALGLDPLEPETENPVETSLTPSQFKLHYRRPSYVTGVTVQPQFSTNLGSWTNGSASSAGTEEGTTFMEAAAPRGQEGRGFGRVRVTANP